MSNQSVTTAPAAVGQFTPTPEQIAKWKQKFGDIFVYEVDDLAAYFCKPTRTVIDLASTMSQDGPLKFNEVLMANCWLDGNEELRQEDKYYIPLRGKIHEIVEVKMGELKKL